MSNPLKEYAASNDASPHGGRCDELVIMAERELSAFLGAVRDLYGTGQAEMSAEVWLDELAAMNNLPGPGSRNWRMVTIAAFARLASHLTATKILAIPSSDCSAAQLLL